MQRFFGLLHGEAGVAEHPLGEGTGREFGTT